VKTRRLIVVSLASAVLAAGTVVPSHAQAGPPPNGHTCTAMLTAPQTSGQAPGFVGQVAREQAQTGQNAGGARGDQVQGFTQATANCGQNP